VVVSGGGGVVVSGGGGAVVSGGGGVVVSGGGGVVVSGIWGVVISGGEDVTSRGSCVAAGGKDEAGCEGLVIVVSGGQVSVLLNVNSAMYALVVI
jgi:hypothetical protein